MAVGTQEVTVPITRHRFTTPDGVPGPTIAVDDVISVPETKNG